MARQVSGTPPGQHAATEERVDLERQLGPSVWLGRVDGPDGDVPVATRVVTAFEPDAPGREEALGRAADLVELSSPSLVPLLGAAERDGTAWLVSEYVAGVPLSRLLGAATLTPVQAVYVALRLLQGLAVLHERGLAHGRLHAANVLVGLDGEPQLTDWALSSLTQGRDVDETVEEDLVHAAALLALLARNVDRPAVRYHDGYRDLVSALEHLGRGEGLGSAAEAAERLDHSLLTLVGDANSTAGPRSELAALVTMLVRRSSPQRSREHPAPRAAIPVPTLLPSGPLSDVDWRRRRPSWVGVAALVAALAALLLGGYAGVRQLVDEFSDVGNADAADRPAASQTPTPSPSTGTGRSSTPREVPAMAPHRAGDITGVSVTPVGVCSAGRSCVLRVTARMNPAPQAREVGLQIHVVNRCTGAVRTSSAGTITAQPGWGSVFVTTTARLPRADAAAVVATTTTPARAASSPLLMPSDGGSC